MSKPSPSRAFLVVGILLSFLGAFVVYAVPPLVTAYFVSKNGPMIVVNYLPALVAGYASLFIGMIFVLVGVSRMAAGIDYLVNVAREPGSEPQRRTREDLLSHE